jgi:hypothetical protein
MPIAVSDVLADKEAVGICKIVYMRIKHNTINGKLDCYVRQNGMTNKQK